MSLAASAVRPIVRVPIRSEVRRMLLEGMLRGDPAPGSSINESELSALLGVSRTPLREARRLAENITAVLKGAEPQPFVYHTKGTLAALGHYKGIGRVYKFRIKGFVAWWVWRTYYLFQMPRWERRLRILVDWTVAMLFKSDVVQLDLFREQQEIRQTQDLQRAHTEETTTAR